MKSHESLLLGDAVETILSASQELYPIISEYQFKRDVVDILVDPFSPEKLKQYSIFVGELTKPLRVVSDANPQELLFTVPALVQSPITTVPKENGITTENFLRSLSRDIDLGGRNLNTKIEAFMLSITKVPNYLENVIKPINEILKRYDRQITQVPGLEQTNKVSKPIHSNNDDKTIGITTTFSDEYDD